MWGVYRLFGSELSPYSVKVRSCFRYKGIPHQWIIRDAANQAEFEKYARLPLIPLVVTPDGQGLQDSTPILEHFEAIYREPSIHRGNTALRFLSALVEEYADEWVNKPMFHFRWYYEADRKSAAERIARSMAANLDADALEAARAAVEARMVPRLKLVGSSPETKDVIEQSLHRQLAILDTHLARRRYLFGARPALADFGLSAQLYQCSTDPTPSSAMSAFPHVLDWIQRMLQPAADGDFEDWNSLAPTLEPLLREEIGRVFLPWSVANARALAAGAKSFAVMLRGRRYAQEPQKYHAKSLAALRARYEKVADRSALDGILRRCGCYEWLAAAL